tara:strand:+ start:553 stop:3018 length:2466 start_codon:yes stop_codon:yes gene_type:complete
MARQPRQERIGFYGKFQPTGVDQSGAKRIQALAGLAEQVGGMAEQFGKAKADELAPEQAAKAVKEAITIDPETKKTSMVKPERRSGWGARVYNSELDKKFALAEREYVAGVTPEATAAYELAVLEYPNDSVAGMNTWKKSTSAILSNPNISEEANRAIALQFSITENSLKNYYLKQEKKLEIAKEQQVENSLAQSIYDTAVLSAANDSPFEALLARKEYEDFIKDNPLMGSPQVQADLLTELDNEIATTSAFAQLDQGVLQNPLYNPIQKVNQADKIIADLENFDIEMDLTPEQRYAIIRKSVTATNSLKAEIKAQTAISKTEQNRRDSIENVETYIDNSINGVNTGAILENKDIDLFYKDVVAPRIEAGNYTSTEESAANVDYANLVGRVPPAMQQSIMRSLYSNKPDEILYATDTIDRFMETQGINQNAFTNKDIAYALAINTALEYGQEPLDAISQARLTLKPENQATIERKKIELNSNTGDFAFDLIDTELQDTFGNNTPFVGFEIKEKNPRAYDQMRADYIQLSKDIYFAGAENYSSARGAALKMINANWTDFEGEDQFGLMKFNPAGFYGVGNNKSVSWVKDDLYKTLTESFPDIKFDRNKIYLDSDARTAREASLGTEVGEPTYAITYETEYGTIESPLFIGIDGRASNRYTPVPLKETKQSVMGPMNEIIKDANKIEAIANQKKLTEKGLNQGLNEVQINFRKSFEDQGLSQQDSIAMGEQAYSEWLSEDGVQQRLIKSNSPFALIGRGVGSLADGTVTDAIGQAVEETIKKLATGKSASPAYFPKGQEFDPPTPLKNLKKLNEDYLNRLKGN